MAQRLRAEAADFDVILQDGEWLTDLVRLGFEELPLKFETRAPREVASDIEAFTFHMKKHVFRENAFGRIGVMRTARGVNVVIAAVEAILHRVDPAFELDGNGRVALLGDRDTSFALTILGAAAIRHRQLARR